MESVQLQFANYPQQFSATTQIMADLIREYRAVPEIRRKAIEITQKVPERNHEKNIVALFLFVRDKIKFLNDINEVETLQTPVETLKLAVGDCDDKTILLNTLLESIGYQTRFVCVTDNPSGEGFTHVYSQVKLPNLFDEWISMDASRRVALGMEPAGVTGKAIFEY